MSFQSMRCLCLLCHFPLSTEGCYASSDFIVNEHVIFFILNRLHAAAVDAPPLFQEASLSNNSEFAEPDMRGNSSRKG